MPYPKPINFLSIFSKLLLYFFKHEKCGHFKPINDVSSEQSLTWCWSRSKNYFTNISLKNFIKIKKKILEFSTYKCIRETKTILNLKLNFLFNLAFSGSWTFRIINREDSRIDFVSFNIICANC